MPGPTEPEAATGPAREIAGVRGQDRVVGQDPAQGRDRPAGVDARPVPRRRVDDRGRLEGRPVIAVVRLAGGDQRGVQDGLAEQPLVGRLEERLGVGRHA